jgi:hypothetical protein
VVYNNFSRSSNETALHDYNTNFYSSPYEMGKEALVDCLLLSKSHILIRPGTSCLSKVSGFFNPYMETIEVIHR